MQGLIYNAVMERNTYGAQVMSDEAQAKLREVGIDYTTWPIDDNGGEPDGQDWIITAHDEPNIEGVIDALVPLGCKAVEAEIVQAGGAYSVLSFFLKEGARWMGMSSTETLYIVTEC